MSGTDDDRKAPSHAAWRKGLVAALFAAGLALFFALDGPRYLDLATVRDQRDALRAFTDAHQVAAILIGFALYVAVVALSVPGATVLSLAAGFVFGRWVGWMLVLAGATVGATLVFLAARYVVGDWARNRMGSAGQRIRDGFTANAFSYLLFLRLVPAFPFFLVNLAVALTPIPVRTYVVATFLGIAPGSFVYVNLGEALGRIDSTGGLLSAPVVLAFALLALLSLVPVWLQRRRSGK
jgi:uncharacterized membrane protein YdjX (TVP38/TMEM64 family)